MSNESIEYYKELQRERKAVLECDNIYTILRWIYEKNHFTIEPLYFAYRDGNYLYETWTLNFGDAFERIVITHEFNTITKEYDFWYKDVIHIENKGEYSETVSN